MNASKLLVICNTVPTWLLPPGKWELPRVLPTIGAPKAKALIEAAGAAAVYIEGKEFKPEGPLRTKLRQSGWKPPEPQTVTAEEFDQLPVGTEITVLFATSGGGNANHILWRRSPAIRRDAPQS